MGFADSDHNKYVFCPDIDYASPRPAPFDKWGYTEEEIERGNAPGLNRDSRSFKIGYRPFHDF